ncbi:hypothetical protein AKO1_008760 [Acrasis kona]|uniref:Uncharacterized protein n=1 Tax=Acrasis kona TaxID=1008807 RepID=A0AAW2ZFX7_9EUKA
MLKCAVCGKLYTQGQSQWLSCNKSYVHIDYHGQVTSRHVSDSKFNINLYLVNLKRKCHISWHDIYWRCWGIINTFKCVRCKNNFAGCDYGKCTYHKRSEPVFDKGLNVGYYQCCNQQVLRFDSGLSDQEGCCETNHVVDPSALSNLLTKYYMFMLPAKNEETIFPDETSESDRGVTDTSDSSTESCSDGEDDDDEDANDDEDDYVSSDDDPFPANRHTKYEIFHSFSRRPDLNKISESKKTLAQKNEEAKQWIRARWKRRNRL